MPVARPTRRGRPVSRPGARAPGGRATVVHGPGPGRSRSRAALTGRRRWSPTNQPPMGDGRVAVSSRSEPAFDRFRAATIRIIPPLVPTRLPATRRGGRRLAIPAGRATASAIAVGMAIALALIAPAGVGSAGAGQGDGGGLPRTPEDDRRLAVVVEFADHVLAEGRDRWGGQDSPLFADGHNLSTRGPVVWVRRGEQYIICNLAARSIGWRSGNGLSEVPRRPGPHRPEAGKGAQHLAVLRRAAPQDIDVL